MDEFVSEELLKELDSLSSKHANAMAEMSQALIELSYATDKTIEATRSAIDVSKEISTLLIVLTTPREKTQH